MRPCDKRRLDAIERVKELSKRPPAPKKPPPVVTRCTWADAELLFPGVTAEWRSMLGQQGTCIPPIAFEYRVELFEFDGKTSLHVVQMGSNFTPDSSYWVCTGARDKSGRYVWTHPIPIPKGLLFHMDYRYDSYFGKKDSDD